MEAKNCYYSELVKHKMSKLPPSEEELDFSLSPDGLSEDDEMM